MVPLLGAAAVLWLPALADPAAGTSSSTRSSTTTSSSPSIAATAAAAGMGTKRGLVGAFCNHTALFGPHARN